MPALYFFIRHVKTTRSKTTDKMIDNAKNNAHELFIFQMKAKIINTIPKDKLIPLKPNVFTSTAECFFTDHSYNKSHHNL
jgi:hypothetical protein